MSLIKYIIKRLLSMIPVLFGVLLFTFILARMMPMDPVLAYLPPKAGRDAYDRMYEALGLNEPLWIQFLIYMKDLFTGNWGYSLSRGTKGIPVWELIWQRMPRTIDLTIFSIIIASFIGVKGGVLSSKYRNKWKDTTIRTVSLIGVSIPVFWLGIIMQYFFSYRIPLFPNQGYLNMDYLDPPYTTGFIIIDGIIAGEWYKVGDYLLHIAMPVFCLAFITIASITRQTRSSMLEVLQQDYIRTARAKGCREKEVISKHALKNALIPTVTVIGLNVGALLSGAILTETTFNLNAIGMLLLTAIQAADYNLINAIVFMTTMIFVIVNLLVDIIYAYIDPRIKY